jgi:hypothetical protein
MEQGTPEFCLSCGMPLNTPDAKGLSEQYCKHCTDEEGNVRTREEIKQGMAHWIAQWQKVDHETAEKRAEHYMKAMPAWAEEE